MHGQGGAARDNELQLATKAGSNLAEDDGIKDGGSLGAVRVVWVVV
jgi:hypothetical protein